MTSRAILLGPQRHVPSVRTAVEALMGGDADGVIALVSAGWEEREPEDGEFREHVQRTVVNLSIWSRIERIFEKDPELLEAMRHRHDTLRQVQELYRLRLGGMLQPAIELLRRAGDATLLEPARRGAVGMLQALDREHADRMAAIHQDFFERWRPHERSSVVQQRREVAELLDGAGCLCLAGGHVGVLLHRLQLFDLLSLWGDRPIVAWSAGAMVLSEYVVLFHQEYGQGADVQVMERGFGMLPGIVPLPHARKRLDLRDRHGVELVARRFAPARCVPLGEGQRIDFDGRRWSAPPGTQLLGQDGRLAEVAS